MVFFAAAADSLGPGTGWSARDAAAVALLGLTLYVLVTAAIRRSRATALLGLASLQAAACLGTWGHTPAAPLIIGLVAGWSLLVAMHLGARWPHPAAVLWPIALMLALAWYYDFDAKLSWPVRSNTAVLIAVLLAAGHVWRFLHYRRMAGVVVGANIVFFCGRGVAGGALPVAALIVVISFLLLLGGAAISWHKLALLRMTGARAPTDAVKPGTEP